MTAYVDNITTENLLTFLRRCCTPEAIVTSAGGTTTLTNANSTVQFITGTAVGHSILLPNATTIPAGAAYEFYNQSTKSVIIKYNTGTAWFNLPAGAIAFLILQTAGTQAGVWARQVTNQLGGGSGISPPFVFSKSGGTAVGAYLYVGQTVTSKAGQLAPGTNQLIKMTATNDANVGSNTVIQLQRRTAVATFADITSANITIPSGSYSAVKDFSTPVDIGPDWEISCYNKSGSSVSNPIVCIFLVAA
jgi:hypothetical protein